MKKKRPCSVYLITNRVNGKWYVGKTVSSVHSRWSDHKSDARRGRGCLFSRAIRKYGEDTFDVQTLGSRPTVEEANELEKLWILLLGSFQREFGYNLTFGGEGVRGTEETKKKISETHKRLGTRPPGNAGIERTVEWCRNLSLGHLGQKAWNKGKPLTEEHKKALRVPKSVPSWKKDTEQRTDVLTEDLIRLYSEGESCRKIAARFNTSHATVSWRLNKAGIRLRPGRFQKKTKEVKNE